MRPISIPRTLLILLALALLPSTLLVAHDPPPAEEVEERVYEVVEVERGEAEAEVEEEEEGAKRREKKEEPGPDLQAGTSCVVPEFSFTWPDHRSPVLVTTAEKETHYRVWIEQQPNANELTRGWLRDAPDTAPPASVPRQKRWRKGGKRSRLAPGCWPAGVGFTWQAGDESRIEDHEVYFPWDDEGLLVTGKPGGLQTSVNLVCFAHLFQTPHVLVYYEVVGEDGGALPADSDVPATCRAGRSGPVAVFDKHLIRFDVGTVFALNDSGEYDNSSELAITSTSKWGRKWTGVVDIRFSQLADLDESDDEPQPAGGGEEGGGESGEEGATGGGEEQAEDGDSGEEDGDEAPFSPFLNGGSFLRANAYLAYSPFRWKPEVGGNRIGRSLTMIFGGGFSTVPDETPDFADAKLRYFAGFRFQIIGYNRGRPGTGLEDSVGFFQFGYARDKLWRYEETVETEVDGETTSEKVLRDEQDRFFLESEIEIPRLGTKALRLVLRGFADLPTSGSGPADVRVSALVGVKPDQLAGIFGQ